MKTSISNTSKKISILFINFFVIFAVSAINNDITMVSYEQSWLDSEGTIALKNNTNKEIHNVVFQITYLDMKDTELDYKIFNKNISIAPGKTKKLDITAYEHNRRYHYYKTKDNYGNPTFKIKFLLKDYNVKSPQNDETTESSFPFIVPIISIILFIVFISICVGIYVLVAIMAKKRKRNAALWVALSMVASPFLIIIILLCIGTEDKEEY